MKSSCLSKQKIGHSRFLAKEYHHLDPTDVKFILKQIQSHVQNNRPFQNVTARHMDKDLS